jgi:integrase
MAGGNIYNLQRMLGHSSVTMTERYSHLSPDHLNGATDILKFGVMQETNVIPLQRKI